MIKENDFSINDIMRLGGQLEAVSTSKTWSSGNVKSNDEIFNSLFLKAFGMGWIDSEVLRAFKKLAMKIYDIVENNGRCIILDK